MLEICFNLGKFLFLETQDALFHGRKNCDGKKSFEKKLVFGNYTETIFARSCFTDSPNSKSTTVTKTVFNQKWAGFFIVRFSLPKN